jgi:hypothetical protein
MKILLLLCFCFQAAVGQKKDMTSHDFTYILNDKSSNPKNSRLRVVVGTDTIEAVKTNGRFLLPRIESKFSLLVYADGNDFVTGSMDPEVIENNREITLIKVTDLSKFPRKENKYLIANRYVKVDNPGLVERIMFLILTQKDEKIDGRVYKNRQIGVSKIVYRK